MAAFETTVDQASTGLYCYLGMAPDNMAFDESARACGCGAHTLPSVIEAIGTRHVYEVEYQSLFNPDPLAGVGSTRMSSTSTPSAGIRGPGASPTHVSRTSCWRASSASRPSAPATWTPARMPTCKTW